MSLMYETDVEILLRGVEVQCYRCLKNPAVSLCKVTPHGCYMDHRLWAFCEECSLLEGTCRACGTSDCHYIKVSEL